jgi:hypothetical protein
MAQNRQLTRNRSGGTEDDAAKQRLGKAGKEAAIDRPQSPLHNAKSWSQ